MATGTETLSRGQDTPGTFPQSWTASQEEAPSAGLLLLDLPTELLLEALRDAPHALRSTCRSFRAVLDDSCCTVCVPHPASSQRRLKDLASLLRRLPKLSGLNNNGHDFKTVPFLAACPVLQSLLLTDCSTTSHHLKALSACPQLTSLSLCNCRLLVSLDFLPGLPALRSLNLLNCDTLTGLSPLACCPHLTRLRVSRGRWGWLDLDSVSVLTALQHLEVLSHAEGSFYDPLDIAPLSSCTALTLLNVLRHDVASLVPLAGCTQLQLLHAGCSDAVTDLAPLAGCATSLTGLCLRAAAVADLSSFSFFTSLASLKLITCGATGMGALAPLGCSLTRLHLCCCPDLLDFASLPALHLLTELDVLGSKVATFLPLLACTRLTLLSGVYPGSMAEEELAALHAAMPLLTVEES